MADNTQIQKRQENPVVSFNAFFETRKGALSKIIPRTLTLERVMKVALAAYGRTPNLWNCSQESVYQAINQAVQLGLEPGSPLGHAYLVPYGKDCTLIVGYKGLIALARRSGEIATIESHVVYEKDHFKVRFGTESLLEHEPNLEETDPGKAKFVYAIGTLKDGTKQIEVMTMPQIEAIRTRSRAGNNGPWKTDYHEMARKTVVRRLCKYLPMSIELAEALEADERNENVDLSHLAATATTVEAPPATESETPALSESSATPPTQTERETIALRTNGKPAADKAAKSPNVATLLGMASKAKNSTDLDKVRSGLKTYTHEMDPEDIEAIEDAVAEAERRIGM